MSSFRRNIMMFTRPILTPISVVPEPTISPASGSIFASQTISISISGIAVSAEYSFDNSTWIAYSSPFTIASDTTIYARALDAEDNYSNVVSESYTILPYDAEVEYLETTGTQYISTGISPSNITPIIEIVIYKPSISSNSYPFGCDGEGDNRFSIGFLTNNRIECRIGGNTAYSGYSTGWYTIKLDGSNGGYYINGTKKGTSSKLNYNSTQPMLLFSSYSQTGTLRTILSGVRIASYKLWNGSTILQDMIPVRVGQTGHLYDKVSGNLFSNAGTGDFILGNDVN